MGSCCQKQSSYGDANNEEPSAWQLATMDDFYDSEVSEVHDEEHVIGLHPSSIRLARTGARNDDLNLQSDDEQFVSLDFNLTPKVTPSFRSSLLGASSASNGSSRDHTEVLVLPELAARNDLRGSGSFTGSSMNPPSRKLPTSSHITSRPPSVASEQVQNPDQEHELDRTVIIRNSSSIYESSSADSTTNGSTEKPLGGVLSGEDDEDSVAVPLVAGPASPSKSSTPPSATTTTATTTIATVASPSHRSSGGTNEKGYVPLGEMDDSTLYEDAVSSEQRSIAT